ncbi:hypothetical protein MMC30_006437 [Trapelia coarctata]|nr:hypothetical protein [Trapelia coarctata]
MADLRDLARIADYIAENKGSQDDAALAKHEMSAYIKKGIANAMSTGDDFWLKRSTYRNIMRNSGGRASKKDRLDFNALLQEAIGDPGRSLHHWQYSEQLCRRAVDLVLQDEAGQAMEPDTNIALLLRPKVLVLTGDDHQLPPTFLNAMEYGRKLESHPSTQAPTPKSEFLEDFVENHPALKGAKHTRRIVIDVPGPAQQDAGSTSRYSDDQLKVIDELVHAILRAAPGCGLSIITGYKDQKRKTNQVLVGDQTEDWNPERASIKASTIDAFQGREYPAVILSFVTIDGAAGKIGFLEDRRRLNVALTRAKDSLFILLDYSNLIKHPKDWALGPEKAGKTVFGKFLLDIQRTKRVVKW